MDVGSLPPIAFGFHARDKMRGGDAMEEAILAVRAGSREKDPCASGKALQMGMLSKRDHARIGAP